MDAEITCECGADTRQFIVGDAVNENRHGLFSINSALTFDFFPV